MFSIGNNLFINSYGNNFYSTDKGETWQQFNTISNYPNALRYIIFRTIDDKLYATMMGSNKLIIVGMNGNKFYLNELNYTGIPDNSRITSLTRAGKYFFVTTYNGVYYRDTAYVNQLKTPIHYIVDCLKYVLFIVLAVFFAIVCKKNDSVNYSAAIVGNWLYKNSQIDTLNSAGKLYNSHTVYDTALVTNFADSLQFTANDTAYYILGGRTTYTTYKVTNNQLSLMGSTDTARLLITQLNAVSLIIMPIL
jgi:hypothetical protein